MLLSLPSTGLSNIISFEQLVQVLLFISPFIPVFFIIHKAIKNSILQETRIQHDELLRKITEKDEKLDIELDDMKSRILTLEIKQEERDKAMEKIEKKIEDMFNTIGEIYKIVIKLDSQNTNKNNQ